MQRTVTVESRAITLDGGDSPEGQGASIDGLLLMVMVMRVWASVKPPSPTTGARNSRSWIIRNWRCGGEPVVHEPVDLGLGEGGVDVGSLGVLALSLVGVLVATQGLGGGEVSAAVMAFESPVALAVVGGGRGVVLAI